MKATEAKLLDFLRKSPRFVIPIYQRTYSWTEKQCRQLWDDILRAGKNYNISAHFVGSIVYIEKGLSNLTSHEPMLVIDGQQRLTTVTLLIAALAQTLEGLDEDKREPVDGFSPRKLRNYYLLNPEEEGERYYKLLLSQTDRDSLTAIVAGRALPHEHSLRVAENHKLFERWIAEHKGELPTVCKGLAKLVVVDVALNRDQDNPQLIFESMNSTGLDLSQADLIRNFILMGLEPKLQTELYEHYWRPMEKAFGQEAYGTHFDSFVRDYLTVKTGDIPNIRAVYEGFKAYARQTDTGNDGMPGLVADLHTYSSYYCAIALGAENDKALEEAFQDLRELKVDVAYPFLLVLYRDYIAGLLSKDELLQAVRLVESYVFRRAICAIPTNSLNNTFAAAIKTIKPDAYLESIQAYFLELPSYRRYPDDEEFLRDIKVRDLYKFPRRSYWLRRLENHGRKERVDVTEYTIEHIMPQNDNLSPAWQQSLGSEWQRVQQTWLHTLGNLTLTRYNSEYSDRPFSEKRDMQGGFSESPLRLNEGLGKIQTWDESAICARADRLAKLAVKVWMLPLLSADVRKQYQRQPKALKNTTYTIGDHPHLSKEPTRTLFDSLRKEILALDPCVTEDFLKLYVAYKAETNFVDVVPQAHRLRLSLNLPFHELNDPKGICKDITNIGRWGNGDVEVRLNNVDELPYIMGLIRQALEKQMGNGGSA